MSLKPGARLGPYEILSPIGAGGMGEVYRARDTRLERTVAIKVLPSVFAEDGDGSSSNSASNSARFRSFGTWRHSHTALECERARFSR